MRRPWKRPWPPVRPCTITLVFSSTKMLIGLGLPVRGVAREGDGGACGVEHGGLELEPIREVGLQDRPPLVGQGAVEADDDRCLDLDPAEGLDDPVGDLGALGDAAEDVDEDGLDRLVEVDDLERGRHHVGRGAAADVEEVGGGAAHLVHDVERAHGETGAVGDDADGAVEADVLEALLPGEQLTLVELLGGLELGPLGVAELGVRIEADLGVEGVHLAIRCEDERVDLGQVAVTLV